MEEAFGTSFGHVRAYTDEPARAACEKLGAKAFAQGSSVAFRDTSPSKSTVAHELAHVLQQAPQGGTSGQDSPVSSTLSRGAAETEADAVAQRIESGQEIAPVGQAPKRVCLDGDEKKAKKADTKEADEKEDTNNKEQEARLQVVRNQLDIRLEDLDAVLKTKHLKGQFEREGVRIEHELIKLSNEMDQAPDKRPLAKEAWKRLVVLKDDVLKLKDRITTDAEEEVLASVREVNALRTEFLESAALIYHVVGTDPDDDMAREALGADWKTVQKAIGMMSTALLLPVDLQLLKIGNLTKFCVSLSGAVDVYTKWRPMGGLQSDASKLLAGASNMANLTNFGFSFFPALSLFFKHVPQMVEQICIKFGVVLKQLEERNAGYYLVTGELLNPGVEVGGKQVFDYMKAAFNNPAKMGLAPKWFGDNISLFQEVAEELKMDGVPSEDWVLFKRLDPAKFNQWVIDNRGVVWNLIYGRRIAQPE